MPNIVGKEITKRKNLSFICSMFDFVFARFFASSRGYWGPHNNKGVIHSLKEG